MTDQIYVENGVGRAVMDAINLFTAKHGVTAEWQHDIHPEMQRKQHGDEWWIEDIAARDMAILTQDTAILEGLERQTVIDSGAKVVALANANTRLGRSCAASCSTGTPSRECSRRTVRRQSF